MKKKFKVFDNSTGLPVVLQEKEMIVINSQGVSFIVGMPEYYPYVILLSERVKSYEVVWK